MKQNAQHLGEKINYFEKTWASSLVAVPKLNKLEYVLTYAWQDIAVNCTRYWIPTTKQLLNELGNTKVFSKIDLKLDPESRDITSFSCKSGIYQC